MYCNVIVMDCTYVLTLKQFPFRHLVWYGCHSLPFSEIDAFVETKKKSFFSSLGYDREGKKRFVISFLFFRFIFLHYFFRHESNFLLPPVTLFCFSCPSFGSKAMEKLLIIFLFPILFNFRGGKKENFCFAHFFVRRFEPTEVKRRNFLLLSPSTFFLL